MRIKAPVKVPRAVTIFLSIVLLLAACAAFAGTGVEPGGSDDPLVAKSYVDWKVVELKAGQVLEGKASSELILRRGRAVVVDASGNGIPDLTAGVDIFAGNSVPQNHLLVIPREDGRGIKAQTSAWVMYRGVASVR